MGCQVADESVVVRNPGPVKAGNRLEDKTRETRCVVNVGACVPKAACLAKGGSVIEDLLKTGGGYCGTQAVLD